jgi:hypothetical protein
MKIGKTLAVMLSFATAPLFAQNAQQPSTQPGMQPGMVMENSSPNQPRQNPATSARSTAPAP